MIDTALLNAQQKHAVLGALDDREQDRGTCSDGPQLIIAGAGTGKTNTLAYKTAHLILRGASPERILLMTFARRAAAELSSRANSIIAKALSQNTRAYLPVTLPWMGTFHSVAARLLREHASMIDLETDLSVIDRNDSAELIDVIRHRLGYTSATKRFPKKKTCLDIYSRVVNSQQPLTEILTVYFPYCKAWESELKALFAAYTRDKLEQSTLDYDDLLLYCFHMAQVKEVSAIVRDQFDYVLVDEYQDTNRLQAGILTGFFPTGRGLTVVGDDAQSIYGFRAATVDNILDFPEQFEPRAEVISLTQNYRSHQGILDLSNALLSESTEGYKVSLFSERKEGLKPKLISVEDDARQAEYIVESVLEARESGIALKKQAVLFRSSHHSDRLELELKRRSIPYVKHGGLKFLEAAHVKDLIALIKWAGNPKQKVSAFRVLKLLPGVGPKLAQKVTDYLETQQFRMRALTLYGMSGTSADLFTRLAELLTALHGNEIAWYDQVKEAAHFYKALLEINYDDHFVRYGDIEQMVQMSQQFPSRERFLTELTLDPPQTSSDLSGPPLIDDDFLILSTVHSAKGQEWNKVFVLNVADGNFPNEYAAGDKRALEEERRLFYVAMTRAKDELHLIQPLKYWVPEQQRYGDRHVYGAKSRFLTESVCAHLEQTHYPKKSVSAEQKQIAREAITDIKQSILGIWD